MNKTMGLKQWQNNAKQRGCKTMGSDSIDFQETMGSDSIKKQWGQTRLIFNVYQLK